MQMVLPAADCWSRLPAQNGSPLVQILTSVLQLYNKSSACSLKYTNGRHLKQAFQGKLVSSALS